jgi:hypothetical protein
MARKLPDLTVRRRSAVCGRVSQNAAIQVAAPTVFGGESV